MPRFRSFLMKSKSIYLLKIENVHNCWNALKSNVRFKLLKGNNHNHLLIDKRDSKKKCKITRVKLLENYSTPIYMHRALKNLLCNFLIYHTYSNLSLLTLFFFEGCSTLFRNWIFYPHEIQQEPIYCFYNQLLFRMI